MGAGNVTPTTDELLDELVRELDVPPIPPNSITVRMLMDRTGRDDNTCRRLLDRKVKAGKMGFVMRFQTKYYYPIVE